jgi:hypothetical protein
MRSAASRVCSVPNCGRRVNRREWCEAHYERWRTTGDVHAEIPIGNMVKGNRKGDAAGYDAIHVRLRISRGKASDFACVDCGRPAANWSYNGDDPNEKAELRRGKRPRWYSTDPSFYVPRCVKCHNTHDGHFGQSHACAKFSDMQVAALRAAYAAGEDAASLARRFGISQTHAWNIANGRSRTR